MIERVSEGVLRLMLSVILYGRNDNHGYNYHKRVAISLNCLGELLTDVNDEIIFVDYNSHDELPTIIEAIQDTLTDKAKKLLKLFRVRSSVHARFKTSLPMLEPVARNVALRRSNPSNRWILSTNIDMVFVPRSAQSLTAIVAPLKEGYYCLPRFELPENLWELSLKRIDPAWNLSFLKESGLKLHLNTVVRKKGFLLFDNPGDFQLIPRKEIFEMGGFDESMVDGWHVDANLAKRLYLRKQMGSSLEEVLWGYHCNHTRKASVLHTSDRTENDWTQFVARDDILPVANGADWGLANVHIEEILLETNLHLPAALKVLEEFPEKEYEILNHAALYNQKTYSNSRIFTFIIDHLGHIPKTMNVAYVGYNEELARMIESYLQLNQFRGKLLRQKEEIMADDNTAVAMFDFGFDDHSALGQEVQCSVGGKGKGKALLKGIMDFFVAYIREKKSTDMKFIGININYTDYNTIFLKHLSMRVTSYIAGCSYGYIPKKKKSSTVSSLFKSINKKALFNARYFLVRRLNKYTEFVRAMVNKNKL